MSGQVVSGYFLKQCCVCWFVSGVGELELILKTESVP